MALFKVFVLVTLVTVSLAQEDCPVDGCTSDDVALLGAGNTDASDHYYIGGLFGIHHQGPDAYTCGKTRLRGLLNTEAFFWAIKTYSERAGLVNVANPVQVGGFVMDSCSRTERTIENIYSFQTCRTQYPNVSPRNTVAFVGPDTSTQAMAASMLLNDMKTTVVSQAATSPMLSDDMYEYFLRTVPSGSAEMQVLVKLMQYKAIRYVQVLYADNDFGMGLWMAMKDAVEGTNICVTQSMDFSVDSGAGEIRNFLRDNEVTKYVMVLGTNDEARYVVKSVDNDNELRGQFIFIGTSSWGIDVNVIQDVSSAENAITFAMDADSYSNRGDVSTFYSNLFLMEPDSGNNIDGLGVNTYNPWFTTFWEETFECNFAAGTCDLPNQRLEDVVDRTDPYVPYTLMAVDAIIRGVKNAALAKCGNIHLCSNLLNPGNSRGTDLYNYIKNATSSLNERFFSVNGDAAGRFGNFKVYQVQDGSYVNVLKFNAEDAANFGFSAVSGTAMTTLSSFCPNNPCLECGEVAPTVPTTEPPATTTPPPLTTPALTKERLLQELIKEFFQKDQEFTGVWRDQPRDDNDWKTRFENGHDWIIALGVCAGLGIVCVLVFEVYILYRLMGTKIGKQWRTMWLGQLLLFGLFCAYLVLFAFLFTPTKATCGITRFGVGVSYAMIFAILLVKLMVLLTSKTSADTLLPGDVDSPNYLRGIYQFLMFVFVVGVQVVVEIQWLIQVPPAAVNVISNNGDNVWICNHYTWGLENGWNNMTTFIRTDFENHVISLTYIMFLIVLTTIVAMKAHGIITNHRESVFIGIAAGFSIPVWVAWGLVGGLNKDHQYAQEFGDAAIAFGLFITATIVLFAMFLPKVRQLINMGVEGIYLEDDRDTYYAGSVVMAPPSYKSRPSSVVYVNSNGYNEPVMIGDQSK
ncbi:hypothetical protein ACF0H5_016892 [Mactra antiquata]